MVISFLALLALSCETTIDVDIPREESRLVVNAILEADSSIRMHLSGSRFSLDNEPVWPVQSAEVILFEDGLQVAVLEENNAGMNGEMGWYQSLYMPKAGHSYSIRATKNGFQPVEAETFIGEPVSISDLDYSYLVLEQVIEIDGIPTTYRQKQLDDISVLIDDPAGEENYYEIIIYQDAVRYLWDYSGTEPVPYDTIRQRYNTYLSSDDPVVAGGEFFDDDGTFYGRSLIFSDETFDGRSYRVRFSYDGSGGFSEDGSLKYLVFLRSLHREQYLYIKSLQLQRDTEGNPFAEPVPVYNNIVGGYGIFTGFSHDVETIELEE